MSLRKNAGVELYKASPFWMSFVIVGIAALLGVGVRTMMMVGDTPFFDVHATASGTHPLVGLIWSSTTDPTTGGGVSAPEWQLLIRTDTNQIYFKSGAANTAWTALGGGGGGGGTVTSVSCGTNLSCAPNPIVGAGTVATVASPSFTNTTLSGNLIMSATSAITYPNGDTITDDAATHTVTVKNGADPTDGRLALGTEQLEGTAGEISYAGEFSAGDLSSTTAVGAGTILQYNNATQPIDIKASVGNPNGSVTAPKGSLDVDYTNAILYQNTNGATTWAVVGTGAVTNITSPIFGNGADGVVVFDGVSTVLGMVPVANTYTLTRLISPSMMTVNSGVRIKLAGYWINVQSVLTNNGHIDDDGDNGHPGSTGGAPGASRSAAWFPGTVNGSAGGTNGPGANTADQNITGSEAWTVTGTGGIGTVTTGGNGGLFCGGGGGGGGASNKGGNGGTATPLNGVPTSSTPIFQAFQQGGRLGQQFGTTMTPGSAGAGGGADVNGTGGGGGAPAGWAFVIAQTIAGTGTITAIGGNGGNGFNAGGGGGGGGAGGAGGFCVPVYVTNSGPNTFSVAGGLGGTGDGTGGHGGSGGAGQLFRVNLSGDGT